jgi:hypothetical protein
LGTLKLPNTYFPFSRTGLILGQNSGWKSLLKKNNLNIFEQPEFPPNRGEWKKGVWSQGEWSQEELEVLFKTCKAWDKISEKYPLPSDIRLYRDWAKEVGRYSFHWHLAE